MGNRHMPSGTNYGCRLSFLHQSRTGKSRTDSQIGAAEDRDLHCILLSAEYRSAGRSREGRAVDCVLRHLIVCSGYLGGFGSGR